MTTRWFLALVLAFVVVAFSVLFASAAPLAEVTVTLTDTATAGLPATIGAGPHAIQITNNDTQLAELILLKLAPGKTKDDALA